MTREIGFCIYCLSTKPPLTREHVLPRGLGGNDSPVGSSEAMVLRRATCEKCREVTRGIEETCLLHMVGPVRRLIGLTRKDRRSPTSPVLVRYLDGRETVENLLDDHLLGALALLAFRTAQCFSNATPKDLGVDHRIIMAEPVLRHPEGVRSVGVQLSMDAPAFARMLAKIALGLVIVKLGPDACIPYVRKIITGEDKDIQRYVGGFCEEIPKPDKTPVALHTFNLRHHDNNIIADLQLFSQYGGPVNYVVVGALTKYYVTSKTVRSRNAILGRLR